MPQVNNWHCTGTLVSTILTEDCSVTGYATATVTPATSTPLLVQDAGDITFGLMILIFFQVAIFFALLWNSGPRIIKKYGR